MSYAVASILSFLFNLFVYYYYMVKDMDGMLDDLQYLPPDKEREKDPSTRKLLLEALLRLGATKHGRETMRHVKVYPILRYMNDRNKGIPLIA